MQHTLFTDCNREETTLSATKTAHDKVHDVEEENKNTSAHRSQRMTTGSELDAHNSYLPSPHQTISSRAALSALTSCFSFCSKSVALSDLCVQPAASQRCSRRVNVFLLLRVVWSRRNVTVGCVRAAEIICLSRFL
jgi:hypothetical protein